MFYIPRYENKKFNKPYLFLGLYFLHFDQKERNFSRKLEDSFLSSSPQKRKYDSINV